MVDHLFEMNEWQQDLGTIQSRDTFLLDNDLWSDCIISIGIQNKVYSCHKLYLAKTSDELADKLYNEKNEQFKFSTITPTSFEVILRYIYQGTFLQINDDQLDNLINSANILNLPKHFINHYIVNKSHLTQNKSWQYNCASIEQRDKYILDNNLWTDCSFKVGNSDINSGVFKCHRLVLGKSSPVFAAMLFGNWCKTSEIINIPDLLPQSFDLFLRYAYTGKLNIKNIEAFLNSELFWDFFVLCKKYLLPHKLMTQLKGMIFSNLYKKSSIKLIEQLSMVDGRLFKYFSKVLIQFSRIWFKNECYEDISIDLMVFITKQRKLPFTETDLLIFIIKWIKYNIENENKIDIITSQNIIKQITPLLPFIRLKDIKIKTFVKSIYKMNFLSKKQVSKFLKYILELRDKSGDNEVIKRKKSKFASIYLQGCEYEDEYELNFSTFNTYNTLIHFPFYYLKNIFKTCFINGVYIPSQCKSRKCKSDVYEEDLTLLIFIKHQETVNNNNLIYPNSTCKLVSKTRFTKSVNYNSELFIPFENEINICETKDNKFYYITILPHKSGWYKFKSSNSFFTNYSNFNDNKFILRLSCHNLSEKCHLCFEKLKNKSHKRFCCW